MVTAARKPHYKSLRRGSTAGTTVAGDSATPGRLPEEACGRVGDSCLAPHGEAPCAPAKPNSYAAREAEQTWRRGRSKKKKKKKVTPGKYVAPEMGSREEAR